MDLQARFTSWARKMGYSGPMPNDLDCLVNAETAHIWQQLMEKVKPKQHVQLVRRNILLQRLRQEEGGGSGSLHRRGCPSEAFELWKKRRDLEKRLAAVKERCRENDYKLQKLSTETKLQYVALGRTRDQISEHERLSLLFEAKAEQLELELVRLNEMIASARRLTPVEPSHADDQHEVQAALNECAAKLEQLAAENEEKKCRDVRPRLANDFTMLDDTSFPSLVDVSAIDENETFRGPSEHCLNVELRELLAKHDRMAMMRCLQDDYERAVHSVTCAGHFIGENTPPPPENCRPVDWLYREHVKSELEARRKALEVEDLRRKFDETLESVAAELMERNPHLDPQLVKKALALKVEDVKLKAAETFAQKELRQMLEASASTGQKHDYVRIRAKLADVKKKQRELFNAIQNTIKAIKCRHDNVEEIRCEILGNLRKLTIQCEDMQWTTPLSAGINKKELQTFAASCENCDETDDATLYMLVNIIDAPYSPPETILMGLFREKSNVAALSSLHEKPLAVNCRKYAYDELVAEEGHVDDALEKSKELLHRVVNKNTITADAMRETMKLWSEMPVRDFISPLRLVDGHNYHHYDKIYHSNSQIIAGIRRPDSGKS